MILSFLIFKFLLLSSTAVAIDYQSCSTDKEMVYNHMHSATHVFSPIGGTKRTQKFVKQLDKILTKYEPDIEFITIEGMDTLLKPDVTTNLFAKLEHPNKKLILEGLYLRPFLQDHFELIYDPKNQENYLLVADSQDGSLALNLREEFGLQIKSYGSDLGSYYSTGNIEGLPGGFAIAGEGMIEYFGNSDDLHIVNTDNSEAGHVDQLFTLIPIRKPIGKGKCPFLFYYSSPGMALKMLDKMDSKTLIQNSRGRMSLKTTLFQDCRKNFSAVVDGSPITVEQARNCKTFVSINQKIEKDRQRHIDKLQMFLNPKLDCSFKIKPLPHLLAFLDDLHPNPVNALVLNNVVIIGEQANHFFRDKIKNEIVETTGMAVEFVDNSDLSNGGTHCITNVFRTCKKNIIATYATSGQK